MGIDKLKSDYNSLRQIVDSKLSSTDSLEGVAVTSGRIQHLEELNASLSSRLSELADTQQRLSSDIVLGGPKYKSGDNIRNLALVVLKTIHPEIISVRLLRGKDRRTEPLPSKSSTTPTALTDTAEETLTSEPTTSYTFSSQQLTVSLTSPALAHAIIHSKIKFKKVHICHR